jgi:hypothetical protein
MRHPLQATAVVVLLAAITAPADAQITYDGCRDFRGTPVASISRPNLGDVAVATYDGNGNPVILYDPNVLTWLSPQTRLFFYGHECGHHVLAHAVRNIPFQAEQEADCFGIRELFKRGLLDSDDLLAIQTDLARMARGDWTHLPGPQRAINLEACLDGADGGGQDQWQTVACTHPQHRNDFVVCSHPAHPMGDAGPCNHACLWPNGWGPCHPADPYPCSHPAHAPGDPITCSHPAHPAGHRVRR